MRVSQSRLAVGVLIFLRGRRWWGRGVVTRSVDGRLYCSREMRIEDARSGVSKRCHYSDATHRGCCDRTRGGAEWRCLEDVVLAKAVTTAASCRVVVKSKTARGRHVGATKRPPGATWRHRLLRNMLRYRATKRSRIGPRIRRRKKVLRQLSPCFDDSKPRPPVLN